MYFEPFLYYVHLHRQQFLLLFNNSNAILALFEPFIYYVNCPQKALLSRDQAGNSQMINSFRDCLLLSCIIKVCTVGSRWNSNWNYSDSIVLVWCPKNQFVMSWNLESWTLQLLHPLCILQKLYSTTHLCYSCITLKMRFWIILKCEIMHSWITRVKCLTHLKIHFFNLAACTLCKKLKMARISPWLKLLWHKETRYLHY